ncbi:MAG: hypothetical protein IJT32_03095, partial [Lachnospiraceae bacterium]|nr:hypothetical protein [Lachnospiraceae bacterium]
MKEQHAEEFGSVAQFALIITILSFSGVLVVLNLLLKWEHWTIPLIVICALGCTVTYVSGRLSMRIGNHLYAAVLIIEVFYYTVNSETTYDSTAVIILLLVILSTTREGVLPLIGYAVGMLGVLYSLFARVAQGRLSMEYAQIVRTDWHLVLSLIALFVVERLLAVLKRVDDERRRRIAVLEQENQA